jgi:predicted helicase
VERLLASLRPGGRDFERLGKWLLRTRPSTADGLCTSGCGTSGQTVGGRDAGIDLVAEDHEGGLWAIQAKHHDPA